MGQKAIQALNIQGFKQNCFQRFLALNLCLCNVETILICYAKYYLLSLENYKYELMN
jgi:hypothetical protein